MTLSFPSTCLPVIASFRQAPIVVPIALLVASVVACAPRENWRDWSVGHDGLMTQFPCKPSETVRDVPVPLSPAARSASALTRPQTARDPSVDEPSQARLRWSMLSCDTAVWWSNASGALTYAVMWVDVGSPAEVESMLERLQVASLDSGSARLLPLTVPGATPHRRSGRWQWQRSSSDGQARTQQSAFLARGTLVVQASVIGKGASLAEASVEPFFQALRWRTP